MPTATSSRRRVLSPARRIVVLAAVCVAGAALASGCGGPSSASGSTGTTSTTGTKGTTIPAPKYAQPITSATVTVGGKPVAVPTEVPGQPISPGTDTGGQIIIAKDGLLPYRLFANLGQTITWTNLTAKPVTVRFLYSSVRSKEIPPGGTFTYSSPTGYTFNYVTSNGYRGVVDIGAFQ